MIKIFKESWKNNKRNKKLVLFSFFVFFFTSVIIFILAIVPLSLTTIAKNPDFQPSTDFKNAFEYGDYPANQVTLSNIYNEGVSFQSDFLGSGVNMDDSVKYKNLLFSRGFQTYSDVDRSTYKKMIPLYNGFNNILPKSDKYTRWQDYVNYYEKFTNDKYPKFQADSSDSSAMFGILFGTNMEYLNNLMFNQGFFHSLTDYSTSNNDSLSSYVDAFGVQSGIRYKIINNKYVFYGGVNNNVPIKNIGQVFEQAVYQQLTYFQKQRFYDNNFNTTYASVPVDGSDQKFTYINGSPVSPTGSIDNKNNSQIWGFNNIEGQKLQGISKNDYNSVFNLSDDIYKKDLDIIQNNSSNTIPCIINKTFANKYNYKKGDIITYHADIPLLKYKTYSKDLNSDNKKKWNVSDPHGMFFKISSNTDTSKPSINTGLFYHNMYNASDVNSGQTNSVSYLRQACKENDNWKYNRMNLFTDSFPSKNLKFKVESVSSNSVYKPIIYINNLLANAIHLYTTSTNLNNFYFAPPSLNDFNGVLSNNEHYNLSVAYNAFGNYTAVGMNGSPLIWNSTDEIFERSRGNMVSDPGPDISSYDSNPNAKNNVLGNDESLHVSSTNAADDPWEFNANNDSSVQFIYRTDAYIQNIMNLKMISDQIISFLYIVLSIIAIIFLVLLFRIFINKYMLYISVYKSLGYTGYEIYNRLFSIYNLICIAMFFLSIPISYFISYSIVKKLLSLSDIKLVYLNLDFQLFFSVISGLLFLYLIAFIFTSVYLFSIKALDAFIKAQK